MTPVHTAWFQHAGLCTWYAYSLPIVCSWVAYSVPMVSRQCCPKVVLCKNTPHLTDDDSWHVLIYCLQSNVMSCTHNVLPHA